MLTAGTFDPVTGTIPVNGAFTDSTPAPVQIPAGVSYRILNQKAGASTEYDGVYVDSVNGDTIANGATGTPNHPVSNLTDAFTLVGTYNINRIYLFSGTFLIPSNLPRSLHFVGNNTNDVTVDLNSKNIATTYIGTFENLNLIGTQGDVGSFNTKGCTFNLGLSASFYDFGSVVQNAITVNNEPEFYDTIFSVYGASVSISDTNGAAFYRASGIFTLKDVAGGQVDIHAVDGALITIDASCTAGTINVFGSAIVVNNSTGTCVVNDYTIEHKIAVTYP